MKGFCSSRRVWGNKVRNFSEVSEVIYGSDDGDYTVMTGKRKKGRGGNARANSTHTEKIVTEGSASLAGL